MAKKHFKKTVILRRILATPILIILIWLVVSTPLKNISQFG